MQDIMVLCKRCSKQAPAKQMVLDPVYKLMVCPLCVQERRNKEVVQKELQQKKEVKVEVKKPKGWDKDDELLEKKNRQQSVSYEKLGPDRIKYTCMKCRHSFAYNTVRKYPNLCPNCGAEIVRLGFP